MVFPNHKHFIVPLSDAVRFQAETSSIPLEPSPLPQALVVRGFPPRNRTVLDQHQTVSAPPTTPDCQRHVLHRTIGVSLAALAEDCPGASEILAATLRVPINPPSRFGGGRQPRREHGVHGQQQSRRGFMASRQGVDRQAPACMRPLTKGFYGDRLFGDGLSSHGPAATPLSVRIVRPA